MAAIANYRRDVRDPLAGQIGQYPDNPAQLKVMCEAIYNRCFDDGENKPVMCQVDERAILFLKSRMSCRWSNKKIVGPSCARGRRAGFGVNADMRASASGTLPGLTIFDRPRRADHADDGAEVLAQPRGHLALPSFAPAVPARVAIAPPHASQPESQPPHAGQQESQPPHAGQPESQGSSGQLEPLGPLEHLST